MNNNNIPILVISCDGYSDLWRPFFSIFRKRWPDCPYPVFLGTNHKAYDDSRVTVINIGDDVSWSSGVLAMINQLQSEYFILFLEDFLLTERVDTQAVERLVDIAFKKKPASLRLAPLSSPIPLPTETIPGFTDIAIVKPGSPYRVSTQPAIWRKDVLKKLLVSGFTAWEFEHTGTVISEKMPEQFLGPLVPYIAYDHGVIKGKWKPEGLRICRDAGIEPDLGARLTLTSEELLQHSAVGAHSAQSQHLKESAISGFILGDRITGVRYLLRFLEQNPFSVQPWAILLFGIIGSKPLRWLRKAHLRKKAEHLRNN